LIAATPLCGEKLLPINVTATARSTLAAILAPEDLMPTSTPTKSRSLPIPLAPLVSALQITFIVAVQSVEQANALLTLAIKIPSVFAAALASLALAPPLVLHANCNLFYQ